jgi:hypothetical protein
MINNELLSFIKERRSQGETKEQITDMLVAHGGWDKKDVEEAFDTIDISGTSMPGMVGAMQKKQAETAPQEKTEMKGPVITPLVVTTSPAPAATKPAPAQPAMPTTVAGNPQTLAGETASSLAQKTTLASPLGVSAAPEVAPKTIATPTAIASPGMVHAAEKPAPAPSVIQPTPAQPAMPTTVAGAVQASAPSVASPTPKANPISAISSFFGMARTQGGSKTLEPSGITPSSEPLVHPGMQSGAASPIPSSMMGGAGKPTMLAGAKGDDTIQNLKAKFTEGQIVSPTPAAFLDATAKNSLMNSKPAAASPGGIGFPKTPIGGSPAIKGLSPHMQSGMVPSEKGISSSPVVPTVKPTVPTVQPLAPFAQGQKMAPGTGIGAGVPQFSKPAQMYPTKAPGRKLLGFFMFATGIVCGAVAMHAYLNGYFDPAILWITAMIGKAPAVAPAAPL